MENKLSPMESLTILRNTRGGTILALRLCNAFGLTESQTNRVLDALNL